LTALAKRASVGVGVRAALRLAVGLMAVFLLLAPTSAGQRVAVGKAAGTITLWIELDGSGKVHKVSKTTAIWDYRKEYAWHYVWKFTVYRPFLTPLKSHYQGYVFNGKPRADAFFRQSIKDRPDPLHGKPCDLDETTTLPKLYLDVVPTIRASTKDDALISWQAPGLEFGGCTGGPGGFVGNIPSGWYLVDHSLDVAAFDTHPLAQRQWFDHPAKLSSPERKPGTGSIQFEWQNTMRVSLKEPGTYDLLPVWLNEVLQLLLDYPVTLLSDLPFDTSLNPITDLPPIKLPQITPPQTDDLDGDVWIGGIPLLKIHTKVTKSSSRSIRPTFFPQGLKAFAALKKPATVKASATFTPTSGKALTRTGTSTLTPRPPTPAIMAVQFSGSPTNPAIVVRGTNLGSKPTPNPSYHPAGHMGCPAVSGDTGYDYGTSLYVEGVSKSFAAGRYRPDLNELDCLDLVVTKFTATEVDFHFGPFYAQNNAKFAFNPGDPVRVVVNGASKSAVVKYS
jgi:hypothetical protein